MLRKLKKNIDFKLIGIISAVYLTFVVIYASKNAFFRIYRNSGKDYNWSSFIIWNLLDWVLITIFMMFIAYTTKIFMKKNIKWVYIISFHLLCSFIIGAFTLGVSRIIEGMGSGVIDLEWELEEFVISYIRLIDLHFLIYVSLATIIYIHYYFEKLQENKMQTIKLKDELSKAHLKFLQTQMHPHFLFNTLNGIHSLIDIDKNKSKSMVVDLSDLLRNVLEKKDENVIELQEELDILNKYIHIKKTRFSDQLKFHINIEKDLETVLVPNMLIQPLVENATKHGYSDTHETLEIFISVYKKNNKLVVRVENTGKKLEKPLIQLLKNGTGLNNIRERLKALYNKEYTLDIFNENNKVVTRISFPVKLSISEITAIK